MNRKLRRLHDRAKHVNELFGLANISTETRAAITAGLHPESLILPDGRTDNALAQLQRRRLSHKALDAQNLAIPFIGSAVPS